MKILPATTACAIELATHLRPGDRLELELLGMEPLTAATRSLRLSTSPKQARDDEGRLVACWGVGEISLLARHGSPWMLGTELLDQPLYAKPLVAYARAWLGQVRSDYDLLVNLTYAGNPKAARWLRAIGFTVHEPKPTGPKGAPFAIFEMRGSA